MNQACFFELTAISVIDVSGADAAIIVNNLSTNEVLSLAADQGVECFITDVRGKTIGHVSLFRESDFIRLIGPAGQSARIAEHIDRYTIREDAIARARDQAFCCLVLDQLASNLLNWGSPTPAHQRHQVDRIAIDLYHTNWLGPATPVVLAAKPDVAQLVDAFCKAGMTPGDEALFHQRRIEAGFPWYGIDLDESNLPQELARDSQAISFTKGCYLGQETVARLDALGQVQRKLVRWKIVGAVPDSGATLSVGEKTVGRLTSIAATHAGEALALGFARRSHFDPGSQAGGVVHDSGAPFTGTVL